MDSFAADYPWEFGRVQQRRKRMPDIFSVQANQVIHPNFVIDLAQIFPSEVILVSNLYLGSINHTLLTAEALRRRNIKVKGLIFNGDRNEESERIILSHTKLDCLLRIKNEPVINPQIVNSYAATLKQNSDG